MLYGVFWVTPRSVIPFGFAESRLGEKCINGSLFLPPQLLQEEGGGMKAHCLHGTKSAGKGHLEPAHFFYFTHEEHNLQLPWCRLLLLLFISKKSGERAGILHTPLIIREGGWGPDCLPHLWGCTQTCMYGGGVFGLGVRWYRGMCHPWPGPPWICSSRLTITILVL